MKIYLTIANVISKLIGTSLVVPLTQFFVGKTLNVFIAGFIAVVFSSILVIILDYFFTDLPYNFLWFRRKLYPISKYEGNWIEIAASGERVISIAHIEFDEKRKKHFYYGCAYDKDGKQKATWHANHLSHETTKNAFTFTGIGEHLTHPIKEVRTVGQVEFRAKNHLRPDKLDTGHGSFYDYDYSSVDGSGSENRNDFRMMKIDQNTYLEILSKKHLDTVDDESKFVVEYYKKYAEKLWDKVN